MKKIYSIVNGNIVFCIVISCFIVLCIPCCVFINEFGILPLILCIILCMVCLLIMYKLKYLNYVKISESGIEYKKHLYPWSEISFTISYTSYGIFNYAFRFYFDNKYLLTGNEIKNCKNKGQFIDINRMKDLELILQHYAKKIHVYKMCPYGKNLIDKIEQHNSMIKED